MKKIENYLKSLRINPKKEYLLIGGAFSTYFITAIVAIIVQPSLFMLVMLISFFIILVFGFYYRYQMKLSQIKRTRNDEFINIFTYFRIYLQNGMGIYKAFHEILEYTDYLRDDLNQLINEIDADKSFEPYIRFASKFDVDDVEPLMISIYQMVDQGIDSNYLNSFSFQFDKSIETLDSLNKQSFKSNLESKATYALVGAGTFSVALMFGVISLMEAFSNGI